MSFESSSSYGHYESVEDQELDAIKEELRLKSHRARQLLEDSNPINEQHHKKDSLCVYKKESRVKRTNTHKLNFANMMLEARPEKRA